MTDQEINIAIAEACGWEPETRRIEAGQPRVQGWAKPGHAFIQHPEQLPNYCSDLNAMRGVVDDIIASLWEKYLNNIVLVTKTEFDKSLYSQMRRHNATARQRAEAFLKTFGKWKE